MGRLKDDRGRSYLETRVRPGPGDVRQKPVPFDNPLFSPGILGTHVLDFNWAIADLSRLVEKKAARMP
jgi:hypothetical protein